MRKVLKLEGGRCKFWFRDSLSSRLPGEMKYRSFSWFSHYLLFIIHTGRVLGWKDLCFQCASLMFCCVSWPCTGSSESLSHFFFLIYLELFVSYSLILSSPNLIIIVCAFLHFSCLYMKQAFMFSDIIFYVCCLLYSAFYCDSSSLGEVGGSCFVGGFFGGFC